MIFRPLSLDGAYEISPKLLRDERGYFTRVFCADAFAANNLNTSWVQANTSFSLARGTVRGLHFQRPPASEVKLVRCVHGSIMDVIVDLRSGSPTFGRHEMVELDAAKQNAVYIPKGFAHGFQTLVDNAQLFYMHSQAYYAALESGLNPFDADLSIKWPIPVSAISQRDQTFALLTECASI
jgi:dTDP-4-dehydrorhamnose 3,5-epimerase